MKRELFVKLCEQDRQIGLFRHAISEDRTAWGVTTTLGVGIILLVRLNTVYLYKWLLLNLVCERDPVLPLDLD